MSDPSGQSTTFYDVTNQQSYHLRFDPLGNVIENTLPSNLVQGLAGQLDSAPNLQFNGSRYYDPLVGSYTQPNPFGGAPGALQSLNRYTPDVNRQVSSPALSNRTNSRNAFATTVNLGFLTELNWWLKQATGQGISGGAKSLANYSLVRLTVSASRHKLLTRLPQEAIAVLGRDSIQELVANQTIQTVSKLRLIRGQPLSRSAFDNFLEFIPGDARSTRWAGRLGDDFFGHSFSWLGGRAFGFVSAGLGDALIQAFWPGTGDYWNYDEYGLDNRQFWGRVGVAAGGGLLAFGAAEWAVVGVAALFAPVEAPVILTIGVGVVTFVTVEALYEWQGRPRLYKLWDLEGANE